jgi:hypothetical protein
MAPGPRPRKPVQNQAGQAVAKQTECRYFLAELLLNCSHVGRDLKLPLGRS